MTACCFLSVETDGRFQKVPNGLKITNATRADDGNYTCRAEVESDGRMEERLIQVSVHSKYRQNRISLHPAAVKQNTHRTY